MKKVWIKINEYSNIAILTVGIMGMFYANRAKNIELMNLEYRHKANQKLTEIDAYMLGFLDGADHRNMSKHQRKLFKELKVIEKKITK